MDQDSLRDAEITATSVQVKIPDINLSLVPGQVAYVSENQARDSNDLQYLIRTGAVRVTYVRRYKMKRQPAPQVEPRHKAPPYFRKGTNSNLQPTVRDTTVSQAQEPVRPDPVREDIRKLNDEILSLKELLVNMAAEGRVSTVTTTNHVPETPTASRVVERAREVFIPSIKTEDLTTANVSATESTTDSVSDAVTALKKTRNRKKTETT